MNLVRSSTLLCCLLASAVALPASAVEAHAPSVQLGFRAGYGLPFGFFSDEPTSDSLYSIYSGLFPLWFEGGYRFGSGLYVGLHAQYAFAQIRGSCPEDVSCSGRNLRLGADVGYHFRRTAEWEPWLVLGTGLEWSSYRVGTEGGQAESRYFGFEFLNLQAGAGYRVAGNVRLGPFAMFSVGQFTRNEVTLTTFLPERVESTGRDDLPRPAPHFWLVIGARGDFQL
jgi:hypothetical protein